jgi:hypothetical protein
MMDYSTWSEKFVAVTSLWLDPENPRIPTGSTALDQRALIEELVAHDDVMALAKEFAERGYAPVESLIGHVEEDGKTYVLEGNRRLAALKLLLSPDSAPDSVAKRVRTLAKSVNPEAIRKVRVLFAPTREAAAPLIMQKHTRNQVEKWDPLMQARFYRTLAKGGLTPATLASTYGSTPGDIAKFLRTDAAYEIARLIPLPEAVRTIVHDPRQFQVSALERLMDMPLARKTLGFDFDQDGSVRGAVEKPEFSKGFVRVISDIAKGDLTTRKINTVDDLKVYLSEIQHDLPNLKKKGTFTVADFAQAPSTSTTAASSTPNKPARPSQTGQRRSASVIPSGVSCTVKNERIREIFAELKSLPVEKKPNASAVLFRILVELSIGHYLEKTKKIRPLLDTAKKKGKPNDWFPALRQMLDALLKDPDLSIPTMARKRLGKLVSDKTSSLSVDGLDAFVHSPFTPPTARELRHYWDTFEDLFHVVLHEPPAPSKPAKS